MSIRTRQTQKRQITATHWDENRGNYVILLTASKMHYAECDVILIQTFFHDYLDENEYFDYPFLNDIYVI